MKLHSLKEKYKMEYQIYKEFYKKRIFIALILGISTALIFFFGSFYFEDFIVEQTNIIAQQMTEEHKDIPTHVEKFFSIVSNNLFIGCLIILSGFIPLYGFPLLYGLLSFASVGIFAGYGMIMEYDVLQTLVVAFLPHAVIEVIPILYSVAIGMYVNVNIIKKIFFKKKKNEKLLNLFKQSMSSYLMVVIPMFLLAALVESFVTSQLVKIFL